MQLQWSFCVRDVGCSPTACCDAAPPLTLPAHVTAAVPQSFVVTPVALDTPSIASNCSTAIVVPCDDGASSGLLDQRGAVAAPTSAERNSTTDPLRVLAQLGVDNPATNALVARKAALLAALKQRTESQPPADAREECVAPPPPPPRRPSVETTTAQNVSFNMGLVDAMRRRSGAASSPGDLSPISVVSSPFSTTPVSPLRQRSLNTSATGASTAHKPRPAWAETFSPLPCHPCLHTHTLTPRHFQG